MNGVMKLSLVSLGYLHTVHFCKEICPLLPAWLIWGFTNHHEPSLAVFAGRSKITKNALIRSSCVLSHPSRYWTLGKTGWAVMLLLEKSCTFCVFHVFLLPWSPLSKQDHLAACLRRYQSWTLGTLQAFTKNFLIKPQQWLPGNTFDLKYWFWQRFLASSTSPRAGFPPLYLNFQLGGSIQECYKLASKQV